MVGMSKENDGIKPDRVEELQEMMINGFLKGATLDHAHYRLPKWARRALKQAAELDGFETSTHLVSDSTDSAH